VRASRTLPRDGRHGLAHDPASRRSAPSRPDGSAVDLYWLALGAGGRSVRLNGLVFEAIAARLGHRAPCDLYHSALEVWTQHDRHVIEMAPVWNERSEDRGAVSEGVVGSRLLRGLRMFRYEIRCWHDGRIPDVDEAVDSPQRLIEDAVIAQRVLALVADVPTPGWGRDELHTGEMWDSNYGHRLASGPQWHRHTPGAPDRRGRAPGWAAGCAGRTGRHTESSSAA